MNVVTKVTPPAEAGSLLADFSTLKMEAIRSSETSVNPGSTRCHTPEDYILKKRKVSDPSAIGLSVPPTA
jgi:hypothetical protein